MRLNGNEITIVRGESFSIDRTIVNRDGSPYIVSNKLLNPNILITVADNSFLSKASKVYKYFLPLKDLPRFTLTNPVNLNETDPNGDVNEFPWCNLKYSDKDYVGEEYLDSTNSPTVGFIPKNGKYYECIFEGQSVDAKCQYGSLSLTFGHPTVDGAIVHITGDSNGEWSIYAVNESDWSSPDVQGFLSLYELTGEFTFIERYLPDGTIVKMSPEDAIFTNGKDYKYWVPDSFEHNSTGKWIDYSLRFVKTFASTVTAEWEPKTYYYSIELISGLNPQEGLYDDVTVILPPSKLNVLSNLRGGLK